MSDIPHAAIVGSGFIAHRALAMTAAKPQAVWWPRLDATAGQVGPEAGFERFQRDRRAEWSRLIDEFRNFDVVINAAGMADPTGRRVRELRAANATLPLVLLRAAEEAGVRRYIHISSAAVQGRRPLDESATCAPCSPYGDSKARGEGALLGRDSACSVVVLRATSIHGVHRRLTRSLVRLRRLPVLPVVDGGSRPLPFAHEKNLTAALAALTTAGAAPSIVLQPYEGVTVGLLACWLGIRRVWEMSRRTARATENTDRWLAGRARWASGYLRRADLLVFGQAQAPSSLGALGYRPVADHDEWVRTLEALGGHGGGRP
jgi:nucleoside-diphosphate-sugar epimerase